MRNIRIFFIVLGIIFPNQLYALQKIILPDNGTATVEISASEFNRIKLADRNDGIVKIRANRNELEVNPEQEGGEMYVKLPVSTRKKPINIFISSKKGYTYKLILIPKRIPAEQIFINNQLKSPTFGKQKIYASYSGELIDIYKKIVSGNTKGCDTSFKKKKSYLAKNQDILLIKVEQTSCEKFIVEKHIVKNVGESQFLLRHEDFIRSGIKAVKLNGYNNSLFPQESTELFLIF